MDSKPLDNDRDFKNENFLFQNLNLFERWIKKEALNLSEGDKFRWKL